MMTYNLLSIAIVYLLHLVQSQNIQWPLADDTSAGGSGIPILGFGTWRLDTSNATESVSTAIEAGYRHLDCASAYGNQDKVGRGIANGLAKVGLKRSDIWVTSKLWNNDHGGFETVSAALDSTLSDLGLDYLDLYLMHWPVAQHGGKNVIEYLNTWHAMEQLLETGKVRHIGVSNFSPNQLRNLIRNSKTTPAVHQFETHPYLQQHDWIQWQQNLGIDVTAYSPLANLNPVYSGRDDDNTPPSLLENGIINGIAQARGCTPAQVALKWGTIRRTSVIPKSSHADWIREDAHSLECELEFEDFHQITEIEREHLKRYSNPGRNWGVELYDGLDDA